ncbi:hypothetical protein [Luteibacter sp. E-22]|uniref:hypothetical protein n=1 Tax=Luteibacter sp. E-22 TaxID=3404050 RepID=UPI003CF56FF7
MKACAAACLLVLLSPLALAEQRSSAAPAPAGTVAARARLDALQGQVKSEDAQVRQLKAKVDTLESNTQAARRALEERDRKIAELQRQLEAKQGH